MKPSFTELASGTCSIDPFYNGNCKDTDNFKQVSLYTEINHVTMFTIKHTVKSLEASPFPLSLK